MAGNAPVTAGEALNIEARIWNQVLALLGKAKNELGAQATVEAEASRLVMATNDSGTDMEAFGIGKIDDVTTGPSGDLPAFQFEPTFSLITPAAFGKIAITADFIADGEVGAVYVSGIVPVQIAINHADHKYATLGTSFTALESATSGECRILYQAATTGTVWCLVALNYTDVRLYDDFDGTVIRQSLIQGAGDVLWAGAADESGDGFVGRIQSEVAGVYAGDIMERDGTTDTGVNFANAKEYSGRLGIVPGSLMWMMPTDDQSGSDDFGFEYHGANSGTVDALLYSDQSTAHTDDWERNDQGASRGVKYQFVTRLHMDSTTGEIKEFARREIDDANGHDTDIDAESTRVVGVHEPSVDTYEYVDCATGLVTIARISVADYISEGLHDYLWMHDGTDFVKSYNDGLSAGAATSPLPCFVMMPSAPVNCAGVDESPFEDDFNGTLDTCIWVAGAFTDGTYGIVSNELRMTVDAGNPKLLNTVNEYLFTGDFTVQVDVDIVTYLADTTTSQTGNLRCHSAAGSFLYQMSLQKQDGDSGTEFIIASASDTSDTTEVTDAPAAVSFRVKRVGTTISGEYNTGSGWTAGTETKTSSADIRMNLAAISRWAGGALVVDFDNYTITE